MNLRAGGRAPSPARRDEEENVIREGLTVVDAVEDLARSAADTVVRLAQASVARRGRFVIALSGGSTPERLYRLLAGEPRFRDAVPWSGVHVCWSDERHVPPADRESNYRMAWDALLSHVPIPAAQVHRIAAEHPDAASVASAYERTLRRVFDLGEGERPSFDLLLLGMGPDGHTASLFPGSPALRERTRLVVAPWVETLDAYRITLSMPVLTSAANTLLLVAGAQKAATLRDVLEGPHLPERFPVQGLRDSLGTVMWLVDRAAASALTRRRSSHDR
jgi:6-phosphogluconolactonase